MVTRGQAAVTGYSSRSICTSTQQVIIFMFKGIKAKQGTHGLYSRQLIMFVVLEGFFADSAVVDFFP